MVDRFNSEILKLIKLFGSELHAVDLSRVFILELLFFLTLENNGLRAEEQFPNLAVAVLADHHVLFAVVVWIVGSHLLADFLAVDLHGLDATEGGVGAFVFAALDFVANNDELDAGLGLVEGFILDAEGLAVL